MGREGSLRPATSLPLPLPLRIVAFMSRKHLHFQIPLTPTPTPLQAHYGHKDTDSVKAIKALYVDLELEKRFMEYETASYDKLHVSAGHYRCGRVFRGSDSLSALQPHEGTKCTGALRPRGQSNMRRRERQDSMLVGGYGGSL